MNPEPLRQKLLAAARFDASLTGVDAQALDRVPYAFEKRVMARLAGREIPDSWATLGALLWRAVLPCCAVMILVGAGSSAFGHRTDDLGAQLDAVLLADLDTASSDAP